VTPTLRLRAGAVEWREVEGEVVAVDLRSSSYMAVNKSGAILWPALVEGATQDELVERLVGSFGVEREVAAGDVQQFIEALRENDLLEEC
jgi:Coenzyme PQQ synthesis protein D (PqqD)